MNLLATLIISAVSGMAHVMMKARMCFRHQYTAGYSEDTVCEACTDPDGTVYYKNFGYEAAYNSMNPDNYRNYRDCRVTVIEDYVTDLMSLTGMKEPVYLGWVQPLDNNNEYHITKIKHDVTQFMLQFPHHDPLSMIKNHEGKIVRLKVEII